MKKVLIAILVRNKGHLLSTYLDYLKNFDYDKKSIVLYINTNNNKDNTEQILEEWIKINNYYYSHIEYVKHNVNELNNDEKKPHSWNSTKLNNLAHIRENSLKKTIEYNCDYYFVADIDNFILPHTLKILVSYNKDIIAPMLKCIPEKGDTRANFYFDKGNGYLKETPKYNLIFFKEIKGLIEIPVIHCTYLIRVDIIQKQKISYFDEQNDNWEFIKLMRNAKKNKVKTYLLNDNEYGVMFQLMTNKLDINEEAEYFRKKKHILDEYYEKNCINL